MVDDGGGINEQGETEEAFNRYLLIIISKRWYTNTARLKAFKGSVRGRFLPMNLVLQDQY